VFAGERERERERERESICSSHLGLIRWRVGTPKKIETVCDEPSDRICNVSADL
jgi:hypothetical protein